MTDDTKREVVEHAVRASRDPRWRLFVRGALVVLALSVVAMMLLYVQQVTTTSDLRGEVGVLASQQADAAHGEQQLAGQVRALGATPIVSPAAPVSGVPGPAGQNGQPGRGITGTSITNGHLIVAYTDGHTEDAGQVVGADGKDGRGITGTSVTTGHLVVAYSDGTTADLGSIVGPKGDAGRGVVSETISSDYHLIVSYSDGTTADAGALPPGPAGKDGTNGTNGQPPVNWTARHADGSTETCTRASNFDPSNPTYDCTDSTPSTTTTTAPGLLGGH